MACTSDSLGHIPQLVGDPVDTLTGAVIDQKLEFRLVGPLELRWNRHYNSSQRHRLFALGRGQTHEYDRRLLFAGDHFRYESPVGVVAAFRALRDIGDECASGGLVLRRASRRRYQVLGRGVPGMEFEFAPGRETAELVRLFEGPHEVRFELSASRRLSRIVDSLGRATLAEHTNDGLLQSLTWRSGDDDEPTSLISYTYDAQGNLIQARHAGGQNHTFHYDESGRLIRVTGRKGFSFHYQYDPEGRCIRTSGDSRLYGVTLNYVQPRRLTKVVRVDGGEWSYAFERSGALTRIVDPYGGEQRFVRNEAGDLLLELDPGGSPTRLVYDQNGSAVAKVDADEHWTPLPEDPNRPEPLSHRVARNAAEYAYGRRLDLAERSLPARGTAPPARLFTEAIPNVVTAKTFPKGEVDERFDVRPVNVLWWPEPSTGRVFNPLGKLIRQYDDAGRARQWQYDASGNVSAYSDFDGRTWRYDTGTWHLVRSITDPIGREVHFSFTPNSEVASCTDAGGTVTEYQHDLKDRLVEVRRHGALRERYTRDAAGNLITKSAADGRELLRREIGHGNRLLRRQLASGEEHRFEYDKSGRYALASSKRDRVEFQHDTHGQRLADKCNGKGVTHTFAAWRRLRDTTVFDRFKIQYDSPAPNIVDLTDPTGEKHTIEFLPGGLVQRQLSTGAREATQYDQLGRCLWQSTRHASGRMWTRRYQWSGEGDLEKVQDNQRGDVVYEYDAAHRLSLRVANNRRDEFAYDAADNLLRQPGLAGVALLSGNRLAAANGDAFDYNDRNHIAIRTSGKRESRYTYDSRDQLVRVETPEGLWEADYDPLGRRTRKRWCGQTTEFFWNGDQLAAELHGDGRARLYVYTDPLALTPMMFVDYDSIDAEPDSGQRYFVYTDQLSTPCLIEDAQGQEVWSATIEPFGGVRVVKSSIECHLRFPGHYADPEIGLHYNRFRYYDPQLGRYVQSDPWGLAGGYNVYAYFTNPLGAVDVRGLGEEEPKKGKKPGEDCDDDEGKPLHERKGWVDPYGEQKKVTGDGSCDRDHQPSKAAIKKAADDEIARQVAAGEIKKPTEAQRKEIHDRIDKEALAVVVDHDVHKDGPTHGNKNKQQSEIDKHDLGAAAARDADAMVANAAKHDKENLPAYEAAAAKIKEQTHEGIMDNTKGIISDVMDP